MKKRVLLLLPLFLGACSDSGESPVIKIEKLYAKIESDGENTSSDEKDYANQREELPALKVGDEVKAFLLLDGNGAELKTFNFRMTMKWIPNSFMSKQKYLQREI